jgi:Family of unknown function (DUF6092)
MQRRDSDEVEKACSITGDQAMALLAHLVTSADICRFEPHFYGTFRLIDAASRLIEAMQENGCQDSWLRDFRAEIERKKTWDDVGSRGLLRFPARGGA